MPFLFPDHKTSGVVQFIANPTDTDNAAFPRALEKKKQGQDAPTTDQQAQQAAGTNTGRGCHIKTGGRQ